MRRIVDSTEGRGAYWCRKAMNQGLRHLNTGQERYKDHLQVGTDESGVSTTGKDGHRLLASQPAGSVPDQGPRKPNHLIRNATEAKLPVDTRVLQHLWR